MGNTTGKPIRDGEFTFPVREIPVRLRDGKLKTWLQVSRFNRLAADWIAESSTDAACGFSLTALPACTMAKHRKPDLFVVFDSNELHVENTPHSPQHQLARIKQRRHAAKADVIQHAEANRLRHFNETYRYAKNAKSVLIENFPDYSGPLPQKPEEVRFIYLGGIAGSRHIEEMIDAFVKSGPDMAIDIYGGGAPSYIESLKARIPESARQRVRMLGPVRNAEVLGILRDYHAGFAFYENVNLNSYWCAPNKVYDYLMSGVAVITNDYPGLESVIGAKQLGICLGKISPESIAQACQRITDEKSWLRITADVRKRHSWQAQEHRLLEIYGLSGKSSNPSGADVL